MSAETAELIKHLASTLLPSVFAIILLIAGRLADRKDKKEEFERQIAKEKDFSKQKILHDFLSSLAETHNAFRVEFARLEYLDKMETVKTALVNMNKKAFIALAYIENRKQFIHDLDIYSHMITAHIREQESYDNLDSLDVKYLSLQSIILDALKS